MLPQGVTPAAASQALDLVRRSIHDLDLLGMSYDSDGINPTIHPEIADAFKAAFGVQG